MPRKKSLDKPSEKAHTEDMPTTKPLKTVSATCACGASFEREIKRGRPQVWCPACVLVPFYERTNSPAPAAPVAVAPVVEVEAAPVERIVNVNDPLDSVREIIEAEMAVVNAEHKVRFAALVAEGMNPFDAGVEAMKVTQAEILAVYAPYRRKFTAA